MVALSLCDEALLCLVRDRLLNDFRLAGQTIDVRCCDGRVSLLGTVDAPELKKLAIDLISGLIGVRHVEEELVVRATGRQFSQDLSNTPVSA